MKAAAWGSDLTNQMGERRNEKKRKGRKKAPHKELESKTAGRKGGLKKKRLVT